MNLGKILGATALIGTLNFASIKDAAAQDTQQNQVDNLRTKEIYSLPKPTGKPDLIVDLGVKKRKSVFSVLGHFQIGEMEIRKNSIYASVLFNHYQFRFEQLNDTTFLEQVFTREMKSDAERHEVFTTRKRKDANGLDYYVLTNYQTLSGSPRSEKTSIVNKRFNHPYKPAVLIMNSLLKDNLDDTVSVILMGEPYTFIQKEKILDEKQTPNGKLQHIAKYASMSDITVTKYNTFWVEDYVNIYADRLISRNQGQITSRIMPRSFEAKFVVANLGNKSGDAKNNIFNGSYHGLGTATKK